MMNNIKHMLIIIFINFFLVAIYVMCFSGVYLELAFKKNSENSIKIKDYANKLIRELINEHN